MRASVGTSEGNITADTNGGVKNRVLLTDGDDVGEVTTLRVLNGGTEQIGKGTTGGGAGKINIPNAYTGAHTLTAKENLVTDDSTGGGYTVTLPPVASSLGQEYTCINIGTSNSITYQANGSESIQVSGGSAANTQTLAALTETTFKCVLNHAGTAVWWMK